ncbi:MAG: hypothetical protein PVS3B3_14410 [Ktedonobacteraceae bacterium]
MKRLFLLLPIFALLSMVTILITPAAHADGGAPNLAYVAGTDAGVSVIDVAQQKVTRTISMAGKPATILLSNDARFLYATEPDQNRVAVLGAKDGNTICTANVPGKPTLLALDLSANNYTLFAAGNAASTVSAIDPTNCSIKHTYSVNGSVYGLAVAQVGSGINGSNGSQLWVADTTSLTYFDNAKQQQLGSLAVPGGPGYISIPPGETVYATTRTGSVIAVDLNNQRVITLVTGGAYGAMDYDQNTGEIYVPDRTKNQLVVLTPINPGSPVPHQPSHVVRLNGVPQSIAITSDGQLGFAALANGNIAMVDIPGRQTLQTIHVGGSPTFVITGLYPPALGTTPQQASVFTIVLNVAAYALVIGLFIVPIFLFRGYMKAEKQKSDV